MKKYIAVLLCALMLMAFCACETEPEQIKDYPTTPFQSADVQNKLFENFTFQYPMSWSAEIDVDPNGVTDMATIFGVFSPPGESTYMASFSVLMAKNQQVQTMDIKKEYVLSLMEDMAAEVGAEFEMVDFGYYNLGGEVVALYTVKTVVEGVDAEVTQAIINIDDTLYSFNVNVYADENRTDAYAILSSLVFGKQGQESKTE